MSDVFQSRPQTIASLCGYTEQGLSDEMLVTMAKAKIRPELMWGWIKTGRMVTEQNRGKLSKADLTEWNNAINEYFEIEPVLDEFMNAAEKRLADNPPDRDSKIDPALLENAQKFIDDQELSQWLDGPFVLLRPSGSRLHRLADDLENARGDLMVVPWQCFVVGHDWAAAFGGDREFDDHAAEWKLPASHCSFEFRVSGRNVILFLAGNPPWEFNSEGGPAEPYLRHPYEQSLGLMVEGPKRWVTIGRFVAGDIGGVFCDNIPNQERAKPLADMLLQQVRASCVGMDAKVIETEVVRAPEKLNKAWVKRGRAPLVDYHTLDLTRRRRSASTLPTESGTHATPRCHFRRGHWRHYANFKTWIRWTLVGDPDLGFVDKHYKL